MERRLVFGSVSSLWWWLVVAGWVGVGSDGFAVAVSEQVAPVAETEQGPAAFVAEGVVGGAEQGPVGDAGCSAFGPVFSMMGVGPGHRSVAERDGAPVPIAGDHRFALRPGEEPLLAPGHLGVA